MTDTIKFLKVRDVKSPSRANEYDAGIDFYVPEFTKEFIKDLRAKNSYVPCNKDGDIQITDNIQINPHQKILIPSGIYCQMASPHRALIAANKSGVASKLGLIFGAQVVDSSYQGEIHINLINTTDYPVIITPGMKIIQFLEMPIYTSNIEIFENMQLKEFYEKETTRGPGGFGSTDHK